MEGKITVSRREFHRMRVFREVVEKRMTLVAAAALIGMSYRIELHSQQYADTSDTHFTELLREREGIPLGRETVRQILRTAGHPPRRRRRPPKHRGRRHRKECRGQMIQWDGSPHPWFGPGLPPCCLLAAVDDATTTLVAALFTAVDSSEGYLRFALPSPKSDSAFVGIFPEEIYRHVAFAYEATVGNDNTVRLGGIAVDIPPGPARRSYAKASVLVRQHLDGSWTVSLGSQQIAVHTPTPLREPIRSWKSRKNGNDRSPRTAIQVYIASKPALPSKETFSLGR